MGLIGALLPFGAATQLSEHNGAFLWYNIGHIVGIVALILYIVGIVTSWLLVGLILLLVWFVLEVVCTVLLLVGSIFHIMACKGDEGIVSAFKSFGLSIVGACTLSFYTFVVHAVSLATLWVGVGFIIILVAYVLDIVCFVIAFLAAKKEA